MPNLFSLLAAALLLAADNPGRKPNIVVILADDLGYADLGCQGSKEVVSPQIDSIAANGVRCTAGYVTAPQCCPSRAGFMTGRYQNRFGFEANWPAGLTGRAGLPLSETTMADRLKAAEYSTDAFGRAAVEFIERHRGEPFFLYLAFVAPHWPMEAKPEHLRQFAHVPDLHRRTFRAMMAALDENVGRVLAKLRQTNLERDTLVVFFSDNGGQTGPPRPKPDAPFQYGVNASLNTPCRGEKGDLFEGGIRVPFLVQWKSRIPAGKTFDQPVISLDILPTALAAAGVQVQPAWKLDGVNLLPFLAEMKEGPPHDTLYWRFRFPPNQPARHRWAIRQGDWKLVKSNAEPLSLYNIAQDVGERNNLAAGQPDRVRTMEATWKRWNAELAEPMWTDAPREPGPGPLRVVNGDFSELAGMTEGRDGWYAGVPQGWLGSRPAGTRRFVGSALRRQRGHVRQAGRLDDTAGRGHPPRFRHGRVSADVSAPAAGGRKSPLVPRLGQGARSGHGAPERQDARHAVACPLAAGDHRGNPARPQ